MYKTILFLALAGASAFLSKTHAAAPDDDLKDQYNPVLTAVTSQSIAADGRPKEDNGRLQNSPSTKIIVTKFVKSLHD